MSGDFVDTRDGDPIGAGELLARAAAAEAHARHGLRAAMNDFFLPDTLRLDERMRAEAHWLLRGAVHAAEDAVLSQFSALVGRDAQAGLPAPGTAWERLQTSELLHQPDLIGSLLARVRLDQMGAALPSQAPDDPERPSLVARFVEHPDRAISDAARGVLIAESRRRSPDMGQVELPAKVQRPLIWAVAAAIRDAIAMPADPAIDLVLCEAARRAVAEPAGEPGIETAAMLFASRVDPARAELSALLVEALRDRRIQLFTALLAHASRLDYADARALVIEPGGERLLLALHALGVPREALAQIGYALCEADPRRDLHALADAVDALETMSAEQARTALAPLSLDPDYRAARAALKRQEGEA